MFSSNTLSNNAFAEPPSETFNIPEISVEYAAGFMRASVGSTVTDALSIYLRADSASGVRCFTVVTSVAVIVTAPTLSQYFCTASREVFAMTNSTAACLLSGSFQALLVI